MKVHSSRSIRRFEVTTDGKNLVSHAGTALLSKLADRAGLTQAMSEGDGRMRHLVEHPTTQASCSPISPSPSPMGPTASPTSKRSGSSPSCLGTSPRSAPPRGR